MNEIRRERKRAQDREYARTHKEEKRAYDYLRRQQQKINGKSIYNKDKAKRNISEKKRLDANPKYKIYRTVQTLLRRFLINGGHKYSKLFGYLGYSFEELRTHLLSTLRDGMTWEQFVIGEVQIDHKIPNSWFEYSSKEDEGFRKCFALNNLQFLYKKDNLEKFNRYAHL